MELLVVIGLIAGLALFLVGGLVGGGKSVSLQAAQATSSSLISAARAKAQSTGKRTRLLVHADLGSAQDSSRFLRMIVLQQADQTGSKPTTWTTLDITYLPSGTYVVPKDPKVFTQLVDAVTQNWQRPANTTKSLGSSLFGGNAQTIDLVDGNPAASFQGIMFTERGTIACIDGSGIVADTEIELVLAAGVVVAPASRQSGQSPVRLPDPNLVRGLSVSSYGVPALINDRQSF